MSNVSLFFVSLTWVLFMAIAYHIGYQMGVAAEAVRSLAAEAKRLNGLFVVPEDLIER